MSARWANRDGDVLEMKFRWSTLLAAFFAFLADIALSIHNLWKALADGIYAGVNYKLAQDDFKHQARLEMERLTRPRRLPPKRTDSEEQ
jgi:hypothetical protein